MSQNGCLFMFLCSSISQSIHDSSQSTVRLPHLHVVLGNFSASWRGCVVCFFFLVLQMQTRLQIAGKLASYSLSCSWGFHPSMPSTQGRNMDIFILSVSICSELGGTWSSVLKKGSWLKIVVLLVVAAWTMNCSLMAHNEKVDNISDYSLQQVLWAFGNVPGMASVLLSFVGKLKIAKDNLSSASIAGKLH